MAEMTTVQPQAPDPAPAQAPGKKPPVKKKGAQKKKLAKRLAVLAVAAAACVGGGFALYCVWQLVFSYGRVDLRYLLLAMRWLPAGLALTWCCDWSRSVWAAVLLHGTIDGLVLLRTLSAV